MAVSEQQLIEALRPVTDPELHMSIVDLGMVKGVSARRGRVTATVALTVAGCPMRDEVTRRVRTALSEVKGVKEVAVDLTVMTPEELQGVRARVAGNRASDPAAWSGSQEQGQSTGQNQGHDHGQAGHSHGGQQRRPLGHEEGRPNPFGPQSRTRVIGISSGKGGVGKSSVTVNLAVALAAAGHDVGILDADVYGFSVPGMLGVSEEPTVHDLKMLPPAAHGVRCISMGFFLDDEQPVVWRGPMLHKALEQFLVDVDWGDPEFLLVDMPPGTGDVALSMAQYLPTSEMYVVTTPQPAARKVAQRSAYMAKKLNLPMRGVIENMSWWTMPDGSRQMLFGEGGGAQLAEELGVPLLAQIPLDPALREGGDHGAPIAITAPDSEVGRAFAALAESVVKRGRARVFRSELTVR
ncbi:MAG TPA: Mrp/NBP35 family ATP-binding protein [Acidimicrobiales bacterium]|nr:Mrp/NBP35 family ATP-binding protein [Acidimicrobiales bacterium]